VANKERGIVPKKIKGFRDIDPKLNQLKQQIIVAAGEVYKSYGFEHWDTPVLEYADNLGKYMPDEDTVDKGVYSFKSPEEEPIIGKDFNEWRDDNGKAVMEKPYLALRYDLTAPLARVYSEKLWDSLSAGQLKEGKMPLFRRFQYGPVHRYEIKLAPGRFREFWQLDFDTVGSKDIASDAEVAIILAEALEAIGLGRETFKIKANNRKFLKGFLHSLGIVKDIDEQNVLRIIDKFDKISLRNVEAELGKGRMDKSGASIKGLGIDPTIVSGICGFLEQFEDVEGKSRKEILDNLRFIDNAVAQEGLDDMVKMDAIWEKLGFFDDRIVFDPTMVRGMAYYTGPIFEAVSLLSFIDEKGKERKIGSICGGGRYDDLVKNLLGLTVPATGGSIGVDRLAALMMLTDQIPQKQDGPILIVYFDDDLMPLYQEIAQKMRKAGLQSEVYYGDNRSLKKQLAYADAKNSPMAILIGSNEAEQGVATVRNLKLGNELSKTITDKKEWRARVQKEVPMDELIEYVLGIRGAE